MSKLLLSVKREQGEDSASAAPALQPERILTPAPRLIIGQADLDAWMLRDHVRPQLWCSYQQYKEHQDIKLFQKELSSWICVQNLKLKNPINVLSVLATLCSVTVA